MQGLRGLRHQSIRFGVSMNNSVGSQCRGATVFRPPASVDLIRSGGSNGHHWPGATKLKTRKKAI